MPSGLTATITRLSFTLGAARARHGIHPSSLIGRVMGTIFSRRPLRELGDHKSERRSIFVRPSNFKLRASF